MLKDDDGLEGLSDVKQKEYMSCQTGLKAHLRSCWSTHVCGVVFEKEKPIFLSTGHCCAKWFKTLRGDGLVVI